ncbi:hypothetical protein [Shinella pollutisoli]|uniref:Uncharacterized protein n=1 Tax=Shinella pollutisoli TaxID=2250594 RepID=A0ABV7DL07_9HYPH|nr:hypothetical protein [Shinella pollutisoli]
MVALKLSAFGGEQPLIKPRLLPDTAAKEAIDVRLVNGALGPVNKPTKKATVANKDHKTIYRHLGTWLSWAGHVHAAPGPVAQDRLYFTGDGAPKVRIGGVNYPLKVPRPSARLTTSKTGTGSGDIQSRLYVYTFVTSFGEESAPAPASAIVTWRPGQTITLSDFQAAPAGRSITRQRIYRSQTGTTGTSFFLIADRAASTADFVDNVAVDAFQEPLKTASWSEPPDGLSGLIAMPNGMMAAFEGKNVYFCEPWHPHAWPEKYIMQVDSEVVGLAAVGGILVVMTKAHPYLMSGGRPDAMRSEKLERSYPCINARSIVDLGYTVCYASHAGLVSVGIDGSVALLTESLFSVEDWRALSPTTVLGGQLHGQYVLFYDTLHPDTGERDVGAMFLNTAGQPYIVRTSAKAAACYFDVAENVLYFKEAGSVIVLQFDPPAGVPSTLHWRSKEFWLTAPVSLGAILVDAAPDISEEQIAAIKAEIDRIVSENADLLAGGALDGELNACPLNHFALNGDALQPVPRLADFASVTIAVYADGELLQVLTRTGKIMRLKAGRKARCWEVGVSASREIEQIVVASSVEELKGIV